MVLMYPRTVKVRSSSGTVNEYVRVVEAYREGGEVKQRVVADLGRKDLLVEVLPKLRRLLTGAAHDPADPQFGASPTSSASSPTWCFTTSPVPTSRARARTSSPSTATAATASRRMCRWSSAW